MMVNAPGEITQLLHSAAEGDRTAMNQLVPLVYPELRRLAGGALSSERPGHTLQPTALVHEAYVRLLHQRERTYHNRIHFIAVAATIMRQILIDHARARKAAKRGGGVAMVSLEEACASALDRPQVLVALADALDILEKRDPHKARLVEMYYFGGLTLEETAEVSGTTIDSVRHHLRVAQAFLHRELRTPREVGEERHASA